MTHGKPNNGEKTHPLSSKAIELLRELAKGPVKTIDINPGLRDRLRRENLAEEQNVFVPGVKGGVRKYVLTAAGREVLQMLEINNQLR